ncbi:MAG: hypothetical protein EKK35_24815 [Bradyrhizobiaceae bacterium]|nr:MAG: hypothetical protein EKK35_24815 [Bradyrhizobiaceae bacterium]
MQRRRFSREFKIEAVKLVRERGVCEAMGVSRPGFHAWLNRSPSARSRSDETVGQQVKACFRQSVPRTTPLQCSCGQFPLSASWAWSAPQVSGKRVAKAADTGETALRRGFRSAIFVIVAPFADISSKIAESSLSMRDQASVISVLAAASSVSRSPSDRRSITSMRATST